MKTLKKDSLTKTKTAEKDSPNPKFHRTTREEDLAFQFFNRWGDQLLAMEDAFESAYEEASHIDDSERKIEKYYEALELFHKAKNFCYSKGKGGQIHFQDTWEYLHNSQNPCFSYEDVIEQGIRAAMGDNNDIHETTSHSFDTQTTEQGKDHLSVAKKKKLPVAKWFFIIIAGSLLFGIVFALTHLEDVENIEIKNATDANNEQAQAIADILTECEVTNIETVTHDDSLDFKKMKGYRVEFELGEAHLYLRDNKTKQLRFLGEYLYKKGKVVAKATDFTLTSSEMSDIHIAAENIIKQVLASPSTADFPNITKWRIWRFRDETYAQSYVDAQNAFGAEIRHEFQVTWKNEKIKSVIIDGVEYYDSSQDISSIIETAKNEKQDSVSDFIGTWQSKEDSVQFTFNTDGTGQIVSMAGYEDITYETYDNIIAISNGVQYTYTVQGTTLILDKGDWVFECEYVDS